MIIKNLNKEYYNTFIDKMFKFNNSRNIYSKDEIWFVQHYSSFTCGIDKNNLFINKKNIYNKIPFFFNDRGGGIIYHDLGQQLIYTLINLKNYKLNLRLFIFILEEIIINVLKKIFIIGHRINNMRGVYIENKKICFIGLKIRNSIIYYGIALNIKMNLDPFSYIYPCGYKIKVTQIYNFCKNISIDEINILLYKEIINYFNKFKKNYE